jgi:short-subunit dehydrogenase
MKLDGSRIVVTGASRGIGEALARALATRHARVVLVARDADALAKVAADTGGEIYTADLTATDSIDGLVARIEADGPIDALVNNAGVDLTGELTALDASEIERLFTLNLVAPVLLTRAVLPGMRARGRGHIVNVSSLSGTNAVPGLGPYSASKAGLSHFTAALRADLKGSPLRTTLVEIGPVRGAMIDSLRSHAPTERALRRLARLQLTFDLEMSAVIDAIVSALEHDRRHVRLPRRDVLFPLLTEAPRRMSEWLLIGVKPHDPDHG